MHLSDNTGNKVCLQKTTLSHMLAIVSLLATRHCNKDKSLICSCKILLWHLFTCCANTMSGKVVILMFAVFKGHASHSALQKTKNEGHVLNWTCILSSTMDHNHQGADDWLHATLGWAFICSFMSWNFKGYTSLCYCTLGKLFGCSGSFHVHVAREMSFSLGGAVRRTIQATPLLVTS